MAQTSYSSALVLCLQFLPCIFAPHQVSNGNSKSVQHLFWFLLARRWSDSVPEINQYVFSNKELLELLVRKAGVHEGRWVLLANFGFSAGNFGPTADQMSPGAIVAVTQMGIQRAQPDTPEAMSVDAASINPPSST